MMNKPSVLRTLLALAFIVGFVLTTNSGALTVAAQDDTSDIIKEVTCESKTTNGRQVSGPNDPNIPVLSPGTPITWRYFVTNTGTADLDFNPNVEPEPPVLIVTDDQGVTPQLDPASDANGDNVLSINETWIYVATGTAQDLGGGVYSNTGRVTLTLADGTSGTSTCPSWYKNEDNVIGIDIEKYTNGEDADTPRGPVVDIGSSVEWTYRVRNTGQVRLGNVQVRDNRLGTISCPQSTLEPDEDMICRASGTAQSGQYDNNACAEGSDPSGRTVDDCDPSHYYGSVREVPIPEPITVVLFGSGLAALSAAAAMRRKKSE